MTIRSSLIVGMCALALAGCGAGQAAAPAPPTAVADVTTPLAPTSAATEAAPSATQQVVPPSATVAEAAASSVPLAASATALPVVLLPSEAPVDGANTNGAIEDTPQLTEAQAAPTAEPTPVQQAVADSEPVRVVIGSINLDRGLVSVGLDKQRVPIVPKHDIGWYNLSAKPGQGENVVMWGHVLRFKSAPNIPAPFARLKEVGVGQHITVYTANGTPHKYVVQKQVWVTPDQVDYMLPQGSERLTLISCIGDKVIVKGSVEMSNRLVTIAVPEA